MTQMLHLGLDIGSTTVKIVVLNEHDRLVFYRYQRRFSDVRKTVHGFLNEVCERFNNEDVTMDISGSGGIS